MRRPPQTCAAREASVALCWLAAAQHSPAGGRKSMTQRKPNMFLIGAMKSGTTYLRKLLNAHPDIFMCEPEEPSYFVDPRHLKKVYPKMWEQGLWQSRERYLELFQPAGDATVLGEASTNYSKLPMVPGVPERIAAFNPEARFIYVLRDPVERAISHYWHMARHHAEHRPIAEAVRRDRQFVAVSNYVMQLTPFLEWFGRDRVTVLIHERLIADPNGVMRGVYQWLGVDATAADLSGLAEPENVTPDVISMPLWRGIPRRLRQAPALQGAMEQLPPSVRQVLHRLTTRDTPRQSVEATEAVAFLRRELQPQTDELARMLGFRFPEWTTLYGASDPRQPYR
jgi:Sulfotransferase family